MINIVSQTVLDDSHWTYKRVVYSIDIGGTRQELSREILDRGDAVAVLLYDPRRSSIILTRQFRLPAFLNGGEEALIEACAGTIEDGDPETTAIRETREETGYDIDRPRLVFSAYMSPGSVTEKIHFFVAPYLEDRRSGEGGGLVHEGESIEIMEVSFAEAIDMMARGEIRDAKTIMLLQYAQIHRLMEAGPVT